MRNFLVLFMIAFLFVSQHVQADSIDLSVVVRQPTAEETGAADQPVPTGSLVHEFFATTDGDILAINFAEITAEVYQNTFGSNNAPPNPALIGNFPALATDSFITTPGDTSALGGGFDPLPNGDDTFGDTSNDGPQTDFMFARITLLPGATGVFSGRFDIASTDSPGELFTQEFSFALPVPEPSSMILMSTGLIGLVLRRRSR